MTIITGNASIAVADVNRRRRIRPAYAIISRENSILTVIWGFMVKFGGQRWVTIKRKLQKGLGYQLWGHTGLGQSQDREPQPQKHKEPTKTYEMIRQAHR